MDLKTAAIAFLVFVCLIMAYKLYSKEGMEFDQKYHMLNNVNQLNNPPFRFKKCLCRQPGSCLYPSVNGLGTRLYRTVQEYIPDGTQKDVDEADFAAVV